MTSDEYLKIIIANKKADSISIDDWRLTNVKTRLTTWAGQQLSSLKQSGSSAKGTALKGIADFDIFISLKSDTTETLKEIYDKLDTSIKNAGWTKPDDSWKTEWQMWFDGGSRFWNINYIIDKKEFVDFSVNGVA